AAPRLSTVVVLPTPPFWLNTVKRCNSSPRRPGCNPFEPPPPRPLFVMANMLRCCRNSLFLAARVVAVLYSRAIALLHMATGSPCRLLFSASRTWGRHDLLIDEYLRAPGRGV